MIPIIFAALCVAVAAAESSSVSSHSTVPSNMREYEYPLQNYLKPNYSDLSTSTYAGSSPYSKSDSRLYSVAESSSDSSSSSTQNEPRASLATSSYYKSKYGSDSVVNSLRPTAFHTGSSSSQATTTTSASTQTDNPSNHYSGNEYQSVSDYPSSSSSFSNTFGQREHYQQHPYETVQQQPEYAGTRPTGTIYGTYAGAEYPPSRPTTYATHSLALNLFSGLSGPPSDYPHHPHYPTAEDYPSPAATAPHYKTYIMSGSPSYPTSKYSTVLGAIKSLFGGGSGGPMLSDAASSANHMPSYSPMVSSPSYYSPSLMHSASHHMPSVAASSPAAAAAVGAAPPSYYYGSSLSPSTSAYTKSYAPMRFMSGYSGSGAPGSKMIVVRDSGSAHLGASYPATAGLLMASSASYPVKSKISFGPSAGHPSYLQSPSSLQSYTSGPPSSLLQQSYTSGPPSSSYPGSYSSTSSFGGSPFLGYSM